MGYAIKDWAQVFHLKEASRHTEISWTKFPVNRASGKYRRLMATPEGRTAYCVFIGLVRMAARANMGGTVESSAEDVSFETGIPLADCESGLSMLVSQTIGWVVDDRLTTGLKPVEERQATGPKTLSSYSSSSLVFSSSGGGLGEPQAQIPNSVLYNEILKHYPKRSGIRGAYAATSDAVYRIAHARHSGDQNAAIAFLGQMVRDYAKARNGAPMQYTPNPAKWMEQGCYDDDPAAWQTGEETQEQAQARMKKENEEYAAKEAARKAAKNGAPTGAN